MNSHLFIIPLILGLFITVGLYVLHRARSSYAPRTGDVRLMANVGEGTHEGGKITYISDVPLTERFLILKRGSAADRVAICTAADVPIGVATDEVATALDPVNVLVFGASDTTVKMVASAAIAQDAFVEPAAAGRVATLGAGAGNHYVVGRALTAAAAAGDVIEVSPMAFLRVI